MSFDFYPYLYGMGGGVFKNQAAGDYTVTLNSEQGRAALDYYINLAREAGHPKTAAMDQADLIQNMVIGKTPNVMMAAQAAVRRSAEIGRGPLGSEFGRLSRHRFVDMHQPRALAIGWAASHATFPTIASAPRSSFCAGTRPRRRKWRRRRQAASR